MSGKQSLERGHTNRATSAAVATSPDQAPRRGLATSGPSASALHIAKRQGAPEASRPARVKSSYGTLVSWEGVESAVAEVFRRKGLDTDPAAFNQLWRSKQLVYIMYNTLVDKGFEPFSFVTRRALHTAERFHGVELTKAEEDELLQAWHELDPYPDVIEGLKAIRALGYPIMGPLSNGDSEMVRVGIVDRFAEMGFELTHLTADLS